MTIKMYASMAFTIFSTISSLMICSLMPFNQLIVMYYGCCFCCRVVLPVAAMVDGGGISFVVLLFYSIVQFNGHEMVIVIDNGVSVAK